MIGLIGDELQRLTDVNRYADGNADNSANTSANTSAGRIAGRSETAILPDRQAADFRRHSGHCRATHAVVSHWQDTCSRTLRFAGDILATVNRLIDRVDYKKMRPSLYWPYCSACITK